MDGRIKSGISKSLRRSEVTERGGGRKGEGDREMCGGNL